NGAGGRGGGRTTWRPDGRVSGTYTIEGGVFLKLEVLGFNEPSEKRQEGGSIDWTRRLERHAHRLDRSHHHRLGQVPADRLNDRPNICLDKSHGDAVVYKANGSRILC